MGDHANSEQKEVSKRGDKSARYENILTKGFSAAAENPFDKQTNPNGMINMGTSENKVIVDILTFTICDEGDGILAPAPYYGAFKTILGGRMEAITHSIELSSTIKQEFGETSPFELSVGRMEEAYQAYKHKGINVRAIIFSNPINPLGIIYSKAQLTSYLQFANRHKLHVILDEIYFLSIYDDSATMTTGLSLSDAIDPDLLHVVWGFSKDFAISGFRCGLVHTVNKEVQTVLNANSYFQSVPTVVQYILKEFISDFDWLEKVYLPTNKNLLGQAHDYVVKELRKIGIKALESVAGLFVWIDLRKYVEPLSKEGELDLMDKFLDNGIYITPGVAFHAPEYGWFRIIFSRNEHDIKVGVTRIIEVLQKIRKGPVEVGHDEESLDDLVINLQEKIRGSDWLEENTAEKLRKENPELAMMIAKGKNLL
eukprot:Seg212.9 transcript_id=Seg212.9/GoldUCD/mRNA.D3Y31 product="putative inactive 1-aminocyclopropane-1-carboxylate synthase-like protein 2" protein_id=Seg212.9/GoldUCD/D3Y31